MRLYRVVFLFVGFLMPGFAQNLDAQNLQPQQEAPANGIPLQLALDRIKELYKVSFLFAQKNIDNKYTTAGLDKKLPVEQLLDKILMPNKLLYKKISKDYYSIFPGEIIGRNNIGLSQERFSISGIVTDEKGEKLPGTIVFVSGSKYITTANSDGEFRLDGLPTGSYEVVAKMIGFKNFKQRIIIDQRPALINITLHISTTLLDEVTVITPENRRKFLETFKKYFIGESANASKCTILNPDVLNFRYQKSNNTLYANTSDFLVIENWGLGYRLKYLLNKFEFNYKTTLLYYNGSPYFEECDGNAKQRKQWQKNREVAYHGSVRHFFRSVFNNTLKEEGYEVSDTGRVTPAQIVDKNSLWNITYENNDFAYIKLKNKLYVLYGKESSGNYSKMFDFGQSSFFKPLLDSVLIDKNGSFTSTGFLFSGYWSWENVAELLPVDYKMNNEQVSPPGLPDHSKTLLTTTALVSAIDSFAVRMPVEKVYLHIDKPYYTNTDTIWLKAYLLNAALEGSAKSGLLYTELVNDTGRVVLRRAMPVLMGISWGQIALDTLQIPEGSYTLRAYTNWMQNLGADYFFTRPLYIGKAGEGSWLVKADSKTTVKDGRENTEMALQLLGQDGDPVRLQDLQLRLTEGSKTRLREKMQTDIEGKLRFNFDVPPKAGSLTLVAEAKSDDKRVVVPLNLNREGNIDVQFMPEGGNLVAGLTSKIGFKAVGEDGKGIDVTGIVLDSKGKEVTSLKSTYKGMGSFVFTPAANEIYTAKITFPKGLIKTYTLPPIKPSGITLMVSNIPGRDSIILVIQATKDIAKAGSSYPLVGQSGGKICFASTVSFKDGSQSINGKVAKSKFATGIARFTLLSDTGQPIAERIIFIDNHDVLKIAVTPDKQRYQPADSVSLEIKVADKDNNPVQGSFSIAITDDSQVKADSTNMPDINSYMLLQSELKGNIEEPGYYFNRQTPESELNLDNLLLTQGWVAYDWKQVFDKATEPKYRAEKDIEVSGTVKRLNKPQAGLTVSLLSTNKPVVFRDTVTDNAGRFRFNGFPKIDSPAYLLKVKDKKGKVFESVVEMDEFKPADAGRLPVAGVMPWYVNSDTTQLNYNKQNTALQKQNDKVFTMDARQLKEVVITAKKIVKNSHNLNGPGNADQVLDQDDIIKAGKMSFIELLHKKIKGFGEKMYPTGIDDPTVMYYSIYESQIKFVFDGQELDLRFEPVEPGKFRHLEHFNFVKSYILQYNSEDIKGIEVLYSNMYNYKYRTAYEPDALITPTNERISPGGSIRNNLCIYCTPPRYSSLVYVEVTTWSGAGLSHHRTSGVNLHRPLPVSWPKEFYKPKYAAKPDPLFDLRSTVYWQPAVFTDEKGIARASFYTKSKNADYTIILQGADMNGATGYHKKVIVVKETGKSK